MHNANDLSLAFRRRNRAIFELSWHTQQRSLMDKGERGERRLQKRRAGAKRCE